MAAADFTDIGIVDLDLKKTTWSRVHSSMRTLPVASTSWPGIHFFPDIVAAPHGAADSDSKRNEWRARFRAALTTRTKEPDRGND